MSDAKKITNARLFEMMEMMYFELTKNQEEMKIAIKGNTDAIKTNTEAIQKNAEGILRIELVHGKKIDLLLDGYKSHSEKLDHITQELSANNSKWDRYELEILSMKKKIAR
ncbi:MAG: hypothetical protein COA82_08810 [Alkaliphilus sp.]|nr:hypothetical protein [Alkaliphilus transvaalensis]MBN4074481.1 hypothetical protein [bacterium AH-315-E09]PHS32941.1 MAG: hypothetical protein COA82_08810 [Alkaliphilus sp.]